MSEDADTLPTEMFCDPGDPSTWTPSKDLEDLKDLHHGVGLSPLQHCRRELRRARIVWDLAAHDHADPSTWGTPEVVENRHRVQ